MYFYEYSKGLVGLKTNYKKFRWTYGVVNKEVDETCYERCLIKINLNILEDSEIIIDEMECQCYSHYFASPNSQKISFERDFYGKKKMKYVIEVLDNEVNMVVNNRYVKLIRYKFMNLHSIGYILADITAGLLLKNGFATLHCSAIQIREKNILIFAPPKTGKSLSTIGLSELEDVRLLSEDIAITDGKKIYSVPWTSTFRASPTKGKISILRKINKFIRSIPIIEMMTFNMSSSKRNTIHNIAGHDNVISEFVPTDVILLSKGSSEFSLKKSSFLSKILNLNKYEFNYHRAPTILVLDYFNEGITPEKWYNAEKEIIQQLLDITVQNFISEQDPTKFKDSIIKKIFCEE